MPRRISESQFEDDESINSAVNIVRRSSRIAQNSPTPAAVTSRRTSTSIDENPTPKPKAVNSRRTSTTSTDGSATPKAKSKRMSTTAEDPDQEDVAQIGNIRRSSRLSLNKLAPSDLGTPTKILTRRASATERSTPKAEAKTPSKVSTRRASATEKSTSSVQSRARYKSEDVSEEDVSIKRNSRRCVSESPTKDKSLPVVQLTRSKLATTKDLEAPVTPRTRSRRSISKSPSNVNPTPKARRQLTAVSEEPPEVLEEESESSDKKNSKVQKIESENHDNAISKIGEIEEVQIIGENESSEKPDISKTGEHEIKVKNKLRSSKESSEEDDLISKTTEEGQNARSDKFLEKVDTQDSERSKSSSLDIEENKIGVEQLDQEKTKFKKQLICSPDSSLDQEASKLDSSKISQVPTPTALQNSRSNQEDTSHIKNLNNLMNNGSVHYKKMAISQMNLDGSLEKDTITSQTESYTLSDADSTTGISTNEENLCPSFKKLDNECIETVAKSPSNEALLDTSLRKVSPEKSHSDSSKLPTRGTKDSSFCCHVEDKNIQARLSGSHKLEKKELSLNQRAEKMSNESFFNDDDLFEESEDTSDFCLTMAEEDSKNNSCDSHSLPNVSKDTSKNCEEKDKNETSEPKKSEVVEIKSEKLTESMTISPSDSKDQQQQKDIQNDLLKQPQVDELQEDDIIPATQEEIEVKKSESLTSINSKNESIVNSHSSVLDVNKSIDNSETDTADLSLELSSVGNAHKDSRQMHSVDEPAFIDSMNRSQQSDKQDETFDEKMEVDDNDEVNIDKSLVNEVYTPNENVASVANIPDAPSDKSETINCKIVVENSPLSVVGDSVSRENAVENSKSSIVKDPPENNSSNIMNKDDVSIIKSLENSVGIAAPEKNYEETTTKSIENISETKPLSTDEECQSKLQNLLAEEKRLLKIESDTDPSTKKRKSMNKSQRKSAGQISTDSELDSEMSVDGSESASMMNSFVDEVSEEVSENTDTLKLKVGYPKHGTDTETPSKGIEKDDNVVLGEVNAIESCNSTPKQKKKSREFVIKNTSLMSEVENLLEIDDTNPKVTEILKAEISEILHTSPRQKRKSKGLVSKDTSIPTEQTPNTDSPSGVCLATEKPLLEKTTSPPKSELDTKVSSSQTLLTQKASEDASNEAESNDSICEVVAVHCNSASKGRKKTRKSLVEITSPMNDKNITKLASPNTKVSEILKAEVAEMLCPSPQSHQNKRRKSNSKNEAELKLEYFTDSINSSEKPMCVSQDFLIVSELDMLCDTKKKSPLSGEVKSFKRTNSGVSPLKSDVLQMATEGKIFEKCESEILNYSSAVQYTDDPSVHSHLLGVEVNLDSQSEVDLQNISTKNRKKNKRKSNLGSFEVSLVENIDNKTENSEEKENNLEFSVDDITQETKTNKQKRKRKSVLDSFEVSCVGNFQEVTPTNSKLNFSTCEVEFDTSSNKESTKKKSRGTLSPVEHEKSCKKKDKKGQFSEDYQVVNSNNEDTPVDSESLIREENLGDNRSKKRRKSKLNERMETSDAAIEFAERDENTLGKNNKSKLNASYEDEQGCPADVQKSEDCDTNLKESAQHQDKSHQKIQIPQEVQELLDQQVKSLENTKISEKKKEKCRRKKNEPASCSDESYNSEDSEDNSEEERELYNRFLHMEAEEGEETDSDQDSSNDIPVVGEDIGYTTTDEETDESVEEDDSFIDDEEYSLLTLSDEEEEEEDNTANENSGDEIEPGKETDKESNKKKSKKIWSRIKVPNESSEESSEESSDTVAEFGKRVEEIVDKNEDSHLNVPLDEGKRIRKSSLTIQENISIDDIKNASLGERINEIVEQFCSGKEESGHVSLNVSINLTSQPPLEKSMIEEMDREDTKPSLERRTPEDSHKIQRKINKSFESNTKMNIVEVENASLSVEEEVVCIGKVSSRKSFEDSNKRKEKAKNCSEPKYQEKGVGLDKKSLSPKCEVVCVDSNPQRKSLENKNKIMKKVRKSSTPQKTVIELLSSADEDIKDSPKIQKLKQNKYDELPSKNFELLSETPEKVHSITEDSASTADILSPFMPNDSPGKKMGSKPSQSSGKVQMNSSQGELSESFSRNVESIKKKKRKRTRKNKKSHQDGSDESNDISKNKTLKGIGQVVNEGKQCENKKQPVNAKQDNTKQLVTQENLERGNTAKRKHKRRRHKQKLDDQDVNSGDSGTEKRTKTVIPLDAYKSNKDRKKGDIVNVDSEEGKTKTSEKELLVTADSHNKNISKSKRKRRKRKVSVPCKDVEPSNKKSKDSESEKEIRLGCDKVEMKRLEKQKRKLQESYENLLGPTIIDVKNRKRRKLTVSTTNDNPDWTSEVIALKPSTHNQKPTAGENECVKPIIEKKCAEPKHQSEGVEQFAAYSPSQAKNIHPRISRVLKDTKKLLGRQYY